MMADMRLVSPEDIHAARDRLAGVARATPLAPFPALGEDFSIKCENLQRTGSFKFRGAYVRLSTMDSQRRSAGVVAASAGNHGQGVALAASLLGIPCTVFMPEQASLPKVEATKAYRANVRLEGGLDHTFGAAREYAEKTGAEFIHPFDHPDVIAGQGTIGRELLEQAPDLRSVLVPTGGGGLISGIAAAIKSERPDIRVIGVQSEQAAAWPPSLAAGKPLRISSEPTVADGIAVSEPGALTFAHVSELVDAVLTVSEEALSRALLLCLERAKLVVEPAGVAAVAAAREYPDQIATPAAAVISGGNIDPLLLLQLIRHGMNSAGRYLSLRVRLPDRPGALAGLLARLGELSANVLDVAHSRIARALSLGEVDVEVNVETRGAEHRQQVLTELEAAGYAVAARS